MLQVNGISKSYGDKVILEDVSFVINPGERLGLVGPNGCGKTTLLRIMVGQEQPDAGSLSLSPPEAPVGYLAQALEFEPDATIGEVMRCALECLHDTERQVEQLAQRMANARKDELEQAMQAYADALARFEAAGGYRVSHEIDAILAGLGLETLDQETPVDILSGGQKTRLGLARLLLAGPQILLLDEPTNHLDIEALEWLEDFLVGYRGAVLIVSHDRTFLDRTVRAILELDPLTHTLRIYPGNYSDYVEAREREQTVQWTAYKDQQDRIDRLAQEIRGLAGHARRIEGDTVHYHYRKIAKGLARRAVVQRRRLERMLESEDLVEKPEQNWEMKLAFDGIAASGNDVVILEDVSLGYDDRALVTSVDLILRQGERTVLVGSNGSGKTTLLRTIVGQVRPMAGRVRVGANVRIGYYSQEQEGLDDTSTAFDEIRRVATMGETETRSFLHYFLFSGDEVFVPVNRLSYGERARLALAKLVAAGCNLLLLDEPINHLDIASREQFERGLTAFDGTVLIVVHDRYFIDRFATGLWYVEAGTIRPYIDLEDMRRGRRA